MPNSTISCNFPSNVHKQLDMASLFIYLFIFFCVCLFVYLFGMFCFVFFPSMMIYILTIHIHTERVFVEIVQTSYPYYSICETKLM